MTPAELLRQRAEAWEAKRYESSMTGRINHAIAAELRRLADELPGEDE